MQKLILYACVFFLCSCKTYKNPHILITTNFGNVEAELFPDKAPVSVAAFLSYIDSGFYKNSSFYRVLFVESMASDLNTGIIQGGIWQSDNKKAIALAGIPHEAPKQTGLTHTSGTLSLARSLPGTANSEFFICVGDQTGYDSSKNYNPDGLGFAAFGKVVSGMDIVRKIHGQSASGQSFIKPITVFNIERI